MTFEEPGELHRVHRMFRWPRAAKPGPIAEIGALLQLEQGRDRLRGYFRRRSFVPHVTNRARGVKVWPATCAYLHPSRLKQQWSE